MWNLILPAIAPAVTDGLRGIFAKFTGGAGGTPQNVQERIQLMTAETERLKALAEIDKPIGNASLWVINVRGVFRYAAITVIWVVTGAAIFTPQAAQFVPLLLDIAGATLSFVIGERMYLGLKK